MTGNSRTGIDTDFQHKIPKTILSFWGENAETDVTGIRLLFWKVKLKTASRSVDKPDGQPRGRSGNAVLDVSPHALVPLVVWRLAREPAEASAVQRHACSATWPLPTGLWWRCSSRCSTCVGPFSPPSISPPWPCLTTSSVSRGAALCPSGKSMRRTAVKCLFLCCCFATSSRSSRLAFPPRANDKGGNNEQWQAAGDELLSSPWGPSWVWKKPFARRVAWLRNRTGEKARRFPRNCSVCHKHVASEDLRCLCVAVHRVRVRVLISHITSWWWFFRF